MTSKKLAIIKVAVPVPLYKVFDYLLPENSGEFALGSRVLLSFGRSQKVGVIVGTATSSEVPASRLKTISQILDAQSLLAKRDFALLKWASNYYHYPLGEVLHAAFPAYLRRGNPSCARLEKYYLVSAKGKCVKPEQLAKTPKQQQIFTYLTDGNLWTSARLTAQDKNWRPAMKALLNKGLATIEMRNKIPAKQAKPQAPIAANKQQRQVLEELGKGLGNFCVYMLHGVTGSGKTEVYMQTIQKVLDRGLQVLVLLPEISLTPQLEGRFRRRFAATILLSHSKLTDKQRFEAWLQMQQGDGDILLGTRSALFTPCPRLGLIILDEEHDSSFKQQSGFMFSARDLAIVRAKICQIPIILGTATPSLESLYNVGKKHFRLLLLSRRAGVAAQPEFILLDLRGKRTQGGMSQPLLGLITATLAKNEQVLLFLNRRGYAPVLMCSDCAWIAKCHQCDALLVVHKSSRQLRCHHCGYSCAIPSRCNSCKTSELQAVGLGTQRVEASLQQLFGDYPIIRLDRDSTSKKSAFASSVEQINQGQPLIILGTQMLAKGHHFPAVTLVAILDVDSGLFSVDFRGLEKLAQLIVQVAGRAGREEKRGKVVLQTRQPEHPLLTTLLKDGYQQVAQNILDERRDANLPPFSHQALLRAYAKQPQPALAFLQQARQLLQSICQNTLLLGPVPAPMARREGYYHFQLLLQNNDRTALQSLLQQASVQFASLKTASKTRWSLDVDPVDLYSLADVRQTK